MAGRDEKGKGSAAVDVDDRKSHGAETLCKEPKDPGVRGCEAVHEIDGQTVGALVQYATEHKKVELR